MINEAEAEVAPMPDFLGIQRSLVIAKFNSGTIAEEIRQIGPMVAIPTGQGFSETSQSLASVQKAAAVFHRVAVHR